VDVWSEPASVRPKKYPSYNSFGSMKKGGWGNQRKGGARGALDNGSIGRLKNTILMTREKYSRSTRGICEDNKKEGLPQLPVSESDNLSSKNELRRAEYSIPRMGGVKWGHLKAGKGLDPWGGGGGR